MICVALLRKVVGFEYGLGSDDAGKGKSKMMDSNSNGFWIKKIGEWETAKNEQGKWYDEVDSTNTDDVKRPYGDGHCTRIYTVNPPRPSAWPCPAGPTSPVSIFFLSWFAYSYIGYISDDFPIPNHPCSYSPPFNIRHQPLRISHRYHF